MKKQVVCTFAFAFAMQASSIAAVRAEYSGNASGETTRSVSSDASSDVEADNGSVASEDLSPKAVASPTLSNTAEVAYGGHSEADVDYSETRNRYQPHIAVIPMLGGGFWSGPWKANIANDFNFGLALEFPMSSFFSMEVEGSYASYQIGYTNAATGNPVTLDPRTAAPHRFDQFLAGTNGKLYFWRGAFRPYIGAGIDMVYYRGMNYGPYAPAGLANRSYDQMIGAGQLILGAELMVTDSISLGVRGSYLKPLINRPQASRDGVFAAPGCEEAAAIDTSFYRALGTVKVAF